MRKSSQLLSMAKRWWFSARSVPFTIGCSLFQSMGCLAVAFHIVCPWYGFSHFHCRNSPSRMWLPNSIKFPHSCTENRLLGILALREVPSIAKSGPIVAVHSCHTPRNLNAAKFDAAVLIHVTQFATIIHWDDKCTTMWEQCYGIHTLKAFENNALDPSNVMLF